jgi:hypothetical protein
MQIPPPSLLASAEPSRATWLAQAVTSQPADNAGEWTVAGAQTSGVRNSSVRNSSARTEAVKVSLRTTALAFSLPTLCAHQIPPACRPPMLILFGVVSTGMAADRASSTTGTCGNAADAAASILKSIPFAAAFPVQRLLATGLSPALQCGTRIGAQLVASAAGAVLEHDYIEDVSNPAPRQAMQRTRRLHLSACASSTASMPKPLPCLTT